MDWKERNRLIQQARQISHGATEPHAAEYYSNEGPSRYRPVAIAGPALFGAGIYGTSKLIQKDINPHGFAAKTTESLINKALGFSKNPRKFDLFDISNYYYLAHMSTFSKENGKFTTLSNWAEIAGRESLGEQNRYRLKWGDLLLEGARRMEESFAKIPRMLGLSSIISRELFQGGEYYIPDELAKQLFQFHIREFPDANLSFADYLEGVTFSNGNLYKGRGTSGKRILSGLELLLNETVPPNEALKFEKMRAGFSQSRQRAVGMEEVIDSLRSKFTMPFIPVKKKKFGLVGQLPRMLTERYMRLLDSPFEFLGNLLLGTEDAAKAGRLKYGLGFGQKIYSRVGLLNKLGTGGDYTGGFFKLWGRHLLGGKAGGKYKIGAPIIALGILGAYNLVDNTLRNTDLLNNTVFAEGITGALAETVKTADLTYSKLSELTGLTALKEYQEERTGKRGVSVSALGGLVGAGWLSGRIGAGLYGTFTGKGQAWTKGLLSDKPLSLLDNLENITGKYTSKLFETLRDIEKLSPKNISRLDKLEPTVLSSAKGFSKALGKVPLLKRVLQYQTRGGKWGAIGAAAMGIAALPLLPGALGSRARPEDLEAEYSGFKEVPIRKGRFWEMGTSPYEGGRIITHVPNWYQRLLTGARERGVYGEDYAFKPIRRMLKSVFDPYWMEKQEYYTRPYPTTGPSMDGMPVLGTTLGRLFKPPKLMHADELYIGGDEDNAQRVVQESRWEQIADKRLEGKGKSKAISAYSTENAAGEALYKHLTEEGGLLGYAISTLKDKLTGSPDWFDSKPVLEDFNRATGANRGYWDQEIGGALLMSEPLRRVIPNRRFQVEYANPLPNMFYGSSWLPGPGDKGPDLWSGDPYAKIQMGELRLPGTGYEAMHPELKGLTAEEYPDIYRYKILADVAPYADKTREYAGKLRLARDNDKLSGYEISMFDQINKQMKDKKKRRNFREESKGILGAYSDLLFNVGRKLPSEFLTPLSPVHKFGGLDTAVKEYEESLYSSDFAPWGTPIKSFIMPMIGAVQDAAGMEFISSGKKKEREIEEYFDILKYVKAQNLSSISRTIGDYSTAAAYNKQANETIFGSGRLSRIKEVFKGLPDDERDYFAEFMSAKDDGERQKILALSPNNMRRLYQTLWKQSDLNRQINSSDISEEERDDLQEEYYRELSSQGFPIDDNLYGNFLEQKKQGGARNYSDFIRNQILQNYFSEGGYDLPDESWLGWSPLVQLDDIKMKVVQNEGMDIHDVGLWESRERELIRKPYLEAISAELYNMKDDSRSKESTRKQLISMLQGGGFDQVEVFVDAHTKEQDEVIFEVDEDPRYRAMQDFNRVLSHGV